MISFGFKRFSSEKRDIKMPLKCAMSYLNVFMMVCAATIRLKNRPNRPALSPKFGLFVNQWINN